MERISASVSGRQSERAATAEDRFDPPDWTPVRHPQSNAKQQREYINAPPLRRDTNLMTSADQKSTKLKKTEEVDRPQITTGI